MDSVYNGLKEAIGDICSIHDSPDAISELINRCIEETVNLGGCNGSPATL